MEAMNQLVHVDVCSIFECRRDPLMQPSKTVDKLGEQDRLDVTSHLYLVTL